MQPSAMYPKRITPHWKPQNWCYYLNSPPLKPVTIFKTFDLGEKNTHLLLHTLSLICNDCTLVLTAFINCSISQQTCKVCVTRRFTNKVIPWSSITLSYAHPHKKMFCKQFLLSLWNYLLKHGSGGPTSVPAYHPATHLTHSPTPQPPS